MNDNDADARRLHLAGHLGFEPIDGEDPPGQPGYFCTDAELIAFAKQCEANGRAQIGAGLRRVAAHPGTAASHAEALTLAANVADAFNRQESGR